MQASAALVTGGARRLGRHIALALAQNGHDIALHYHYSKDEALATAAEISALGVACELFQGNLADSTQRSALAKAVDSVFPHWNVLINSASIFERGSLAESDEEQLARHMRINFEAPMFLTRDFAQRGQHGVVVNLIDARVHQAKHSHLCYLLSKKALYGFTEMAAVELAPRVRVNAVCPGFVLPSSEHEKDYETRLKARLPMGQVATPQDVTEAVLTLVRSPLLTGQFLYVDGGESLL